MMNNRPTGVKKHCKSTKTESGQTASIQPYISLTVVGWSCVLSCFMLSSLPCFPAFCWSVIPTSCYIFNVFQSRTRYVNLLALKTVIPLAAYFSCLQATLASLVDQNPSQMVPRSHSSIAPLTGLELNYQQVWDHRCCKQLRNSKQK